MELIATGNNQPWNHSNISHTLTDYNETNQNFSNIVNNEKSEPIDQGQPSNHDTPIERSSSSDDTILIEILEEIITEHGLDVEPRFQFGSYGKENAL